MGKKDVDPALIKQQANFCFQRADDLDRVAKHFSGQAYELEQRKPYPDHHTKIEADWRLQQSDIARISARKFKKQGEKLMRKYRKLT